MCYWILRVQPTADGDDWVREVHALRTPAHTTLSISLVACDLLVFVRISSAFSEFTSVEDEHTKHDWWCGDCHDLYSVIRNAVGIAKYRDDIHECVE